MNCTNLKEVIRTHANKGSKKEEEYEQGNVRGSAIDDLHPRKGEIFFILEATLFKMNKFQFLTDFSYLSV